MAAWREKMIDSHCHLWDLSRFSYPWPTPGMKIHRNHLPYNLWAAARDTPVKDVIFVQCLNQHPDEAKWVMELSRDHPGLVGIVAGLDPSLPQFEEHLVALKAEVPLLVGLRHILDREPRKDYLLLDDLVAGLGVLHKHNLTFDLLLRPPLMQQAVTLAGRAPNTRMVVDHLAKPYIKTGDLNLWRQHLSDLARHPNVYCKLSGLVTEAELTSWTLDDLRPCVEHALSAFGPDRVMFGSDWPVCRLASNGEVPTDYGDVFRAMQSLVQHLPDQQQEKIFCTNARKFYNIRES